MKSENEKARVNFNIGKKTYIFIKTCVTNDI